MCGRFRLTRADRLVERYPFIDWHQRRILPEAPRFNIAPSQPILTVLVAAEQGPDARLMKWGFQPAWMKQPKQPPPINARSEGLAESKLFRAALQHGRCVIPADAFYEWQAEGGRKQPYAIRRSDGDLFAFAGLWTQDPNEAETAAIITTGANELMRAIHSRMPVILSPEEEALWLDPQTSVEHALALLRPYPSDDLVAEPASPLVNNARNEGPHLALPISES
jgi:putative SOS response-associated peptidase YedK